MPIPMTSQSVLDRCYLEMRAKVLELGAAFDRIERAGGMPDDERLRRLAEAIAVLSDRRPERAERIQMIFSDKYEPNWTRPTN